MDTFYNISSLHLNQAQLSALVPYLVLCLGLLISIIMSPIKALKPHVKPVFVASVLAFALLSFNFLDSSSVFLFDSTIEIDYLTRIVSISVAFFALIAGMYISENKGSYWAPVMLIGVLSLGILPACRNWITFFVVIETVSITSYILAAYQSHRILSLESSLKYLLMGACSSVFMLLGIALIFGATGSFQFTPIEKFLIESHGLVETYLVGTAVVFISIALAFKVGLAPVHMWVADVYQGVKGPVVVFLGSAVKVSVFAAMIRVYTENNFLEYDSVQYFFQFAGILSIIVGSIMAFRQRTFKRLLAYSGIVNSGYVALAVCSGMKASLYVVFFLVLYGLSFSVLMIASEFYIDQKKPKGSYDVDLAELSLFRNCFSGFYVFVMAALVFSLVGLPPLPGFFSKYFILSQVWADGNVYGAFAILVGTFLGLAYYLRPVINLLFGDKITSDSVKDISSVNLFDGRKMAFLSATGLLVITLFFGLVTFAKLELSIF